MSSQVKVCVVVMDKFIVNMDVHYHTNFCLFVNTAMKRLDASFLSGHRAQHVDDKLSP